MVVGVLLYSLPPNGGRSLVSSLETSSILLVGPGLVVVDDDESPAAEAANLRCVVVNDDENTTIQSVPPSRGI